MNYRKIGGLHWFAIGRLRIAFCITKPKAPDPRLTYADRHYKQLPRANWPWDRAGYYGEVAVERALAIPFVLTAEDDR